MSGGEFNESSPGDTKECVNLLYLASTKVSQEDNPKTSTLSKPNLPDQSHVVSLEKKDSPKQEEAEPEIICPHIKCPEKVVICLDVSQEMEKATFRSRSGDRFSPIKLVKRALGIFLHTKHKVDPRHEFALVLLQDQALWMADFTNDPKKLLTILDDLGDCFQTGTFDLASLFDVIDQHVTLPSVTENTVIPPAHVVRVILLYGRSYCLPTFTSRESQRLLMCSPHFFLDAFYIHEPPTDDNQVEATFDALCELDEKGLFYLFEVSRNPTKMYDCMAKLLPHPLQRPLWKDASYTLQSISEEVH